LLRYKLVVSLGAKRPTISAWAVILLAVLLGCGSGSNSDSGSGNDGGSGNPPPPPPPSLLARLSTDTFANTGSQHATEVEPMIASFGSTLVAVFQVGRFFNGGASGIGYATSVDGGASWANGILPGITISAGGTYIAVSDPAVAYDRAHGVWLASSLAISGNTDTVITSRSADGLNWSGPVSVSNTPDSDKNWVACDNNQSSPFFGHCYVTWDDPSANGLIWISTSTDGGQTWQSPVNTGDSAKGIGVIPVIQPEGRVVVPASDDAGAQIIAFTSADGGSSWDASTIVATISDHQVAGNLRTDALPMSAVDANGQVYVVWQDCRFRSGCSSNDIVMSTSADGTTWTAPVRIPIDAVGSTVDHFIPAIAVDPSTSGTSSHLALVYHYYANAVCNQADCALNVGYVTSQDAGNTWSAPTVLAGPMTLAWLASTKLGAMVGDYVGVTYLSGKAYPAIAVARSNIGTVFDEAIYTTTNPLMQAAGVVGVRRVRPIPGAHSDHPPRESYDEEGRYPRKPPIARRRARRAR
jgi:hypothetical protein